MHLTIDSDEKTWNALQNRLKKKNKTKALKSMKDSKPPVKPTETTPTRLKRLTSPSSVISPPLQNHPPLPDIQSRGYIDSAYLAEKPNLNEWGIVNPSAISRITTNIPYPYYNDYNPDFMFKRYNIDRTHPFYVKERKPYMVVQSFRRKNTDSAISSANTFEYIKVKPYKQDNQHQSYPIPYEFQSLNDEYAYFKTNKPFSDQYVEEFIQKTLQDTIIPDLLIEIIDSIKREQRMSKLSLKNENSKISAINLLNKIHINNEQDATNELFSTKFIEDLDYKAKIPIPTSRLHKRNSEDDGLMDIYIKETNKNIQSDLVKQLNNEEARVTFENFSIEQIISEQIINPCIADMCRSMFNSIINQYKHDIDASQKRNIRLISNEKLLNYIELDILINKLALHGRSIVENDDFNKLIDGMIIDILLHVQNDIRKTKNKTLKNYPLKKFHLNTYMNVALDILTAELALSLEEDMKILNENERKQNKE